MTAGPAAFETQGGAAGERDGDAAAFDAEQHAQRHPHEAGHAAEGIENFRCRLNRGTAVTHSTT
ncbi:hypothetical protein GCM10011587_15510 [Pyruvatibacter mobilis]|nr:hypothetical protein GCM10011587_15510 [Pyruvatibacter mobilis]